MIYQITAIRSTVRRNPAQFIVNFGLGGGGGFAITSIMHIDNAGDGDIKMAA